MNQQSIVDMLEPLRQPAPISWWPPAPGWWFVAAVLLALLLFGLYRLWQRYLRGAPLREARARVETLNGEDMAPGQLAAELGALQRRVAIAILGRKACAGLTGSAWAECLNGMSGDGQPYFDEQLVSLAHSGKADASSSADLLATTERWLSTLRIGQ